MPHYTIEDINGHGAGAVPNTGIGTGTGTGTAVEAVPVYKLGGFGGVSEWTSLAAHLSAGVLSFLLAMVLAVPAVVWTLVSLMAIDIISGTIAAWVTHTISSDASWRGMARKSLVILLVLATELVARTIPQSEYFSVSLPAGAFVAGAFCLHELISITENVIRAGIEPPYFLRGLKRRLVHLSDDYERYEGEGRSSNSEGGSIRKIKRTEDGER